MHIEPKILIETKSLRNEHRVVLITDNMNSFGRFTAPALGLDDTFDGIINSFNEGHLKTEENGSAFIRHLAGEITDAALVDDARSCSRLFEKLGETLYLLIDQDQANVISET